MALFPYLIRRISKNNNILCLLDETLHLLFENNDKHYSRYPGETPDGKQPRETRAWA